MASCSACTRQVVLRVVIDLASIVLAILPTAVLELVGKTYQRGFFCDDDSINYPYHDDTIVIAVVETIGLGVPIITILIREAIPYCRGRQCRRGGDGSCSIPSYVVECYKDIGIFLFGCAISQSITSIGKYSIGRLRPHFLDVCQPNITGTSCLNSDNIYQYIDNFVCTGSADHYEQVDARKSFPSGHSSLATYCAVYYSLYLQARFTWKGSKLLRHFLQALAIYAAIFVCLSRIMDNKHHWSDVLSGAIIGVFCAALTFIHVSKMFQRQRSEEIIEANSQLMTEASVVL